MNSPWSTSTNSSPLYRPAQPPPTARRPPIHVDRDAAWSPYRILWIIRHGPTSPLWLRTSMCSGLRIHLWPCSPSLTYGAEKTGERIGLHSAKLIQQHPDMAHGSIRILPHQRQRGATVPRGFIGHICDPSRIYRHHHGRSLLRAFPGSGACHYIRQRIQPHDYGAQHDDPKHQYNHLVAPQRIALEVRSPPPPPDLSLSCASISASQSPAARPLLKVPPIFHPPPQIGARSEYTRD